MGSDASHLNLSPSNSHWLSRAQIINDFQFIGLFCCFVHSLSLFLSYYSCAIVTQIIHKIHSKFEFQISILNDFNTFNNNKQGLINRFGIFNRLTTIRKGSSFTTGHYQFMLVLDYCRFLKKYVILFRIHSIEKLFSYASIQR